MTGEVCGDAGPPTGPESAEHRPGVDLAGSLTEAFVLPADANEIQRGLDPRQRANGGSRTTGGEFVLNRVWAASGHETRCDRLGKEA